MKTMARMLRQRLSNRITEFGRQAKAVLVNILIIKLASLIIVGVFPGVSLFVSIGFF